MIVVVVVVVVVDAGALNRFSARARDSRTLREPFSIRHVDSKVEHPTFASRAANPPRGLTVRAKRHRLLLGFIGCDLPRAFDCA